MKITSHMIFCYFCVHHVLLPCAHVSSSLCRYCLLSVSLELMLIRYAQSCACTHTILCTYRTIKILV